MDDVPSRQHLRALVFWASRWLVGGSEYYRGPLRVTAAVDDEHGSDRLTMRPKAGDEVYDARSGPGEQLADLAPRLLATFLSKDAREVMGIVAARGPIASKAIANAVTVERSKCYSLLADLRERGLIRDTGDGYQIAAPEVWAAVAPSTGESGARAA